jgi:type I restriction enzyme, R subunit
VVIATIQRVYSTLTGAALAEDEEEASSFERGGSEGEKVVAYNPAVPIESFDLIVTDECHRSIYGAWRQVLDYFDAFILGLTATPSLHTMGFFNRNLVAQYPYERSVVDGVNVGFEVFRIKTEIGERGATVKAGYDLPIRDKRTRAERYETLTEDFAYAPNDLDKTVIAPNQIRTVVEAYRDSLFTELFPGRREVLKTLVFAKDDHHAEEIVGIVRDVFGRGNDFAKKITYRTDEGDPEKLIRQFRNDFNPRIAVTVDMIATGTDVKPIEASIFLRDVRASQYLEQMKGRGARTIAPEKLRQVTPDAEAKTRFVLIDAVGVTESLKSVSQPLERDPTSASASFSNRSRPVGATRTPSRRSPPGSPPSTAASTIATGLGLPRRRAWIWRDWRRAFSMPSIPTSSRVAFLRRRRPPNKSASALRRWTRRRASSTIRLFGGCSSK